MFEIIMGAFIYAIGVQCFIAPVDMVTGGVTGISMIVNLLTNLPVGTGVLILNIPIFIIALKKYGLRFMLDSLVGMAAISIFLDVVALTDIAPTHDPLLASIYGGVIMGTGLGLIFHTGATTGGSDVVVKLIKSKYPYVNFGTFYLAIDFLVIFTYAILFKEYEKALYTVISVFACSRLVDMIIYGFTTSKLCYIISEKSEEIKSDIVDTLHRGVTVLNGKGAYSGTDKQVLLCVVKRTQIIQIKQLVKNIDQKAFVIVSDARDVFGEGFDNINIDK